MMIFNGLLNIIPVCVVIGACVQKKPALSNTQIVNGKSIVIPPEFDIKP